MNRDTGDPDAPEPVPTSFAGHQEPYVEPPLSNLDPMGQVEEFGRIMRARDPGRTRLVFRIVLVVAFAVLVVMLVLGRGGRTGPPSGDAPRAPAVSTTDASAVVAGPVGPSVGRERGAQVGAQFVTQPSQPGRVA